MGGGGKERGVCFTDVAGHASLRHSARGALQDKSRGGAANLAQTCTCGPDFVVGDDGLEEAEGSVCKVIFVNG